jgi:hypothetical protein
MEKANMFWALLKESVIISGILALALVGALIYMAIMGMEIPEILAALAGTAVGFFMGGKAKVAAEVLKK